ncbi:MAG TPA: hypothetical protein VFA52_02980 [Candidatus Paceibacterota bacterium]|nr:hypothetical protein [Candidatus Paceibacterota bacterium]
MKLFKREPRKRGYHFAFAGVSRFNKETAYRLLQSRFRGVLNFYGRPRAGIGERTKPQLFSVLFPPLGFSSNQLLEICLSYCLVQAEKVRQIIAQGKSVISWHAYVEATKAHYQSEINQEDFSERINLLYQRYGNALLPDQLFYPRISEEDGLQEAQGYLRSLLMGPYDNDRILENSKVIKNYEEQILAEPERWKILDGCQHPSYIADEITRHLIDKYNIRPSIK